MIALLVGAAAPKLLEKLAYVVASFFVVFLIGTSSLGLLTQPWAPFWLSGGATANQPLSLGTPLPVSAPAPPPTVARAAAAAPVPTLAPLAPTGIAEGVIALAMTWRGTPYLWGGCTKRGVDCSCYMQNIFSAFGVNLPRTTTEQIRVARAVSASEARAGDLVFFDNTCTECGANPTHVGLYMGGGMMIDAGDPVQVERVYSGHNARYGRVIQ